MTIRKLPGSQIESNTITITQIQTTAVTNIIAQSGPKVTSITYPNSTTAAVNTGNQSIVLTGTGFESNVQVYVNGSAVPAVSRANANSLSFTTPALSTGTTYPLYVVNPDGGTAVFVPGMVVSSGPVWVTDSTLPSWASSSALSTNLQANSDSTVSYALDVGSSLPSGLSLAANGVLSGTLTSPPASATTYNFTVVATDLELQKSSKAFSITATIYDFTISPAVGGVSTWYWATNGTLTLTEPGEYTLSFGSNATKTVKMWGSGGKASTGGVEGWGNGGAGGAAVGNVSFVAGSTYKVRVPAAGGTGSAPALTYGAGNGGGTYSCGAGGSGGGYAGIFLSSVTQANAVFMAGGGGGGASSRSDCRGGRAGGAGGGTNGTTSDIGGGAGTQSAGGTGSTGGSSGSALQGGNGTNGGAGGGGGYYGGGGGGSHSDGGSGGGGGSGYFNPSLVSNVTLYTGSSTTAGNNGDSDRGGAGSSGVAGSTPANGKVIILA